MRGSVVLPGDDAYDPARHIWNGMVDRRPAAILRCADTPDVVRALAFARATGLPIAIRAGGHSIAGKSICDGGIVIDLSPMSSVAVDPATRTVRCGAGALLRDMDAATQAHGLAVSSGIVGHTGVAGLTLGGGMGRMSRRHGLTCDNLLEAEVVLAGGEVVCASPAAHADLFWGLCGGGANLGIVTSFTFRAQPVGPTVFGGLVLHAMADAPAALRRYRDFCRTAPDGASVDAALLATPDGRFLATSACHIGTPEEGARDLAPLRAGQPIQDMMAPLAYTALQTSMDELFAHGQRFYWKSCYMNALPDEAIEALVALFAEVPAPPSLIVLQQMGGAIARRPEAEAAFAGRGAQWNCIPIAIWTDPAEDDHQIAWARGVFEAMRPFASGGVYVNDLGDEGEERVRAAYGANFARLSALKAKYDPENVFRANQNVRPVA
jgi:FAD/FMN-containing dehydrogenase